MIPRQPTDPLLGVIPADPALRRIALIGWAVIATIGAGVLWYVTKALSQAQAMAVYDPRGAFLEVQRVIIPAVAVGMIAGIALSAYCLVMALRTFRAGRFPAPGARVLRATPVRRGAAATRIGVAMVALSIMLLGVSVTLPLFLRRVMQAVEQSDHRFPAVPPPDPLAPADTAGRSA